MKKIILFFMLSFGLLTHAENTEILRCKVQNAEWTSVFTLDAVANAYLIFKKTGDENTYSCGLKVDDINNGQRAIVPNVTVRLSLGQCTPELGVLTEELFDKYALIVDIKDQDKPKGRVQWLRKKQPDLCEVEAFRMFEISNNSKKWLQGKWGRSTASEPKKINKKK